jgi:protein subunit release factor A
MEKERKLLFRITKKDMNMTFFSGHGGGGQNRNRHMNCVRINHKDSGAMVTGQSHKERKSNIREALNNLVKSPKFKVWHSRKVKEVLDKQTIAEEVDKMMVSNNLKIEQLCNDRWEKYDN